MRGADRAVDVGGGGVGDGADGQRGVERRDDGHRRGAAAERRLGASRRGCSSALSRLSNGSRSSGSLRSTPALLRRPLPKMASGSGIAGLRLGVERGEFGDRIADQRVDRHVVVGDAVDERRIGAVFEQAADEVGEQFLVAADRRVDPHRGRRVADPALELGEFVVQPLAHAVEALEFERGLAGQRLDRADGVGVVRGEGRVDAVRRGEHPLGAGEVGDVGRDLAREHRIVGQAGDLRGLDLAVPIGALDEPDHQRALVRAGEVDDPVDQRHGALRIGLEREPEAAPAIGEQGIVGDQRLDDVERQFEAVGFLGVDRQMDVGGGGLDASASRTTGRIAALASAAWLHS